MFKKKLLNKAIMATVLGGMMLAPNFALAADVNITSAGTVANPNVVNYQVTLPGTYAVNTANSDVLKSVTATNPYVELRIKSDKATTYLVNQSRANLTKAINNVVTEYAKVSTDMTNVKVVLCDADGLPYASGKVVANGTAYTVTNLDFVFTRPMNPTTAGNTYKYYPMRFDNTYIATATDTSKVDIDLTKVEGDVKAALLLNSGTAAWSRTLSGVSVIADGTKLDAGVIPYGIYNSINRTLTVTGGVNLTVKGTNPVGVYAGNVGAMSGTTNSVSFSTGTVNVDATGGTAFLAENKGRIGHTGTTLPTYDIIKGDIIAKGAGYINLPSVNTLTGDVKAEDKAEISLGVKKSFSGKTSVADTANLTLSIGDGVVWNVADDSSVTALSGVVTVADSKTLSVKNLKDKVTLNMTASDSTVKGGSLTVADGAGSIDLHLINVGGYTDANIDAALNAMAKKVTFNGGVAVKGQASADTKDYTDTAFGEKYIADVSYAKTSNSVGTAEKYLSSNKQVFGSKTKDVVYAGNISVDENNELVYTFDDNLYIERHSIYPVDGTTSLNTSNFWSSIFSLYGDDDPLVVSKSPAPAGVYNYSVDMKGHKLTAISDWDTTSLHNLSANDRTSVISVDREGTLTFNNVGGMDLFSTGNVYYSSAIHTSVYGYTPTGGHIAINNGDGWEKAIKVTNYLTDPLNKSTYSMNNYIVFVDARNSTLNAPAGVDTNNLKNTNTIDIKGLVDIEAKYGQFAVTAWGTGGRIDIGGGKIVTKALASEYAGTGMPAISTTGNSVVNFNIAKDVNGKAVGAGNNPVMVDGTVRTGTDFYGSGGTINLGLNTDGSYLNGDVKIESTATGDPTYQANGQGAANLWIGNGAKWTGNAYGVEIGALKVNIDKDGVWEGYADSATPELNLKNGGLFKATKTTTFGELNVDGGKLEIASGNKVNAKQGTVKYTGDMVVGDGKLVIDNMTTLTAGLDQFFTVTDATGSDAGELKITADNSIQLVGGYLQFASDTYTLEYVDAATGLVHGLTYGGKASTTTILFDGKLILSDDKFGVAKMQAADPTVHQSVEGIADGNLTFGVTVADVEKNQISHGLDVASLYLIGADTVNVVNGAKLVVGGTTDNSNIIHSTLPEVIVNVSGNGSQFVVGTSGAEVTTAYQMKGDVNVSDKASMTIKGAYTSKGDLNISDSTLIISDGASLLMPDKARKSLTNGNKTIVESVGYAVNLTNSALQVGKDVVMDADLRIGGTSTLTGGAETSMLFGDVDAVLKVGAGTTAGKLQIDATKVNEPYKQYPAATTYSDKQTGSYNGTMFIGNAVNEKSVDGASVVNYKKATATSASFNGTFILGDVVVGKNGILSISADDTAVATSVFKNTGLTWGEDVSAAIYVTGPTSQMKTANGKGIYVNGGWEDVPESSVLNRNSNGGVVQLAKDSLVMVDASSDAVNSTKTNGLFNTYFGSGKHTLMAEDGAKIFLNDAVEGTAYHLIRNSNINAVNSANWSVGNPWYTELNSDVTAKGIFTNDKLIRFVRVESPYTSQAKYQYAVKAVKVGTTNLTVQNDRIILPEFTNAAGVITTLEAEMLGGKVTNEGTIAFLGGTLTQVIDGAAVTIADNQKLILADGGSLNGSVNGYELDLAGHTWTVLGDTGSSLKKFRGGSEGSENIIFMNSSQSLKIDEYSGNSKVFYTHTNDGDESDDYVGGAVRIGKAYSGSVITLITDNTGIDTSDVTLTNGVLDKLANKLYYINAGKDTNLTGKVAIAEGLTARSAYITIGDVIYNPESGQAGYGKAPETLKLTSKITGDKTADTDYVAAGITTDGTTYKFEYSTGIEVSNLTNNSAVISSANPLILKVTDGATLKVDASGTGKIYAVDAKNGLTVDAGKLVLNLHSTGNAYGGINMTAADNTKVATINGDVDINVHSSGSGYSGYTLGMYISKGTLNLNGALTMKGDDVNPYGVSNDDLTKSPDYYASSGIYATGGATVNVDDVDLVIYGNGIYANNSASVVNVGGGDITINKDNTTGLAAIMAGCASVNMNIKKDAQGNVIGADNNDVHIQGALYAHTGTVPSWAGTETGIYTTINLGLNTATSTWVGTADNAFNDDGNVSVNGNTYYGAINLYLANGATWTNEEYGTTTYTDPWAGTHTFTGSHLAKLVGGTEGNEGVIIHKDINPLTIDSYSGNTKILLAHNNMGTQLNDYIAGNITVKSATKVGENNSVITLVTDSKGIDTENKELMENALGALAKKLTYSAFVSGEDNLTGYVEIAEGLTAKSASVFLGGIEFNDTTGQGSYLNIEPEPGPEPEDPKPTVVSDKVLTATMSDSAFLGDKVQKDEKGVVTYTLNDQIYSYDNMMASADSKAVLNLGDTVLYLGNDKIGHALVLNDGANITVNGNLNLTAYSPSYSAAGIAMAVGGTGVGKETHLTINGKVTMGSAEKMGVVALDKHGAYGSYAGTRWTGAGINMNQGHGSTIDITGGVDMYVDGHGIVTDPYYTDKKVADYDLAVVNVNGATNIVVSPSEDVGVYALASYGGTININMKDGAPGKDKVTIIGNAIAMKDTLGDEKNPYFYRNGRINLALTTADSVWTGAVDNTGTTQAGEFNLYLQNGGTWDYQNASKMNGLSAGTMPTPSNGFYGNYDGVSHMTNLVGGRNSKNCGVIKMAAEFNDNIAIDYYSGNTIVLYKHNSATPTNIFGGDIRIADAKVASVITLSTNADGITEENSVSVLNALANKLYYTADNENLIGKVQIAEGLTAASAAIYLGDVAFDEATGKGFYTSEKNTTIVETALGDTSDKTLEVVQTIDSITYTMDKGQKVDVSEGAAVQSVDGKELVVDNKKVLILASTDSTSPVVNADKGNVKINGTVEVVGEVGQTLIDVGTDKAVELGGAELKANGTGAKVVDLKPGATVSVGIVKNQDGSFTANGKDVKVTGDVQNIQGVFNMALATADSFWKGNYANDGAVLNLVIDNKDAKWEGTVNGAELNVTINAGTWVNKGTSKSDSNNFTLKAGGVKKAFVDMTQGSGKITIDNYSGGMTLMYSNDAITPTTINGDDVIIKSAAADSVVNLWTDGKGLDLTTEVGQDTGKDNAVKAVLNALAKKLTYVNYADGHITGEVGVGEALTRPAVTFPKAAELVFTTADGKGSIDASTFKDNITHGEVVYGDSETAMMRGAKMAMASTAMVWRAEGNDLTKRMGDLQLRKEEAGVWAKYYSGRQEYNNNGSFSNKYKAVQVGVDKTLGHGWLGGVALSYDDGKGSLNNGGRADNKVQSLGFYGTKVNKNGEYIDLIGKFSRLENEYTVYNDYGYSLDGDYKNFGMSVSAEYGKHINLKNGLVLTPAVEFTMGRVNSKNYDAYSEYYDKSMTVKQDAFNSAIGRIGISLGKETGAYSYYAKLGLAHEFAGGFDTTYSAPGEPTSGTSVDFKDTWKEVQVGGSVKLKNDALLYGSFSKSFGGDVKEKWRVDAGLMFTFNHISDFFGNGNKTQKTDVEEVAVSNLTNQVEQVEAPAPVIAGTQVENESVTVGDSVAVAEVKPVKSSGNTYVMDECIVTASKTKQRITDATADVSVVTRAEIEAMHMNSVEEALRTVPGVEFNNYGSGNQMNANLSSLRINGSKDVAVLVDGVKINDFQGVGESGNMYAGVLNNMNNIERVEVLRGAAGVLYGSGAKGGVINIITREINENQTIADASVGSFGRKDTKFSTMGKAGKLTYNFSQGTYKQGDVTDGRGEKWEGHTKTNNFGGKVTYNFTDNNKLTLDYMDIHSNFGGTDLIYSNFYSGKYDSTMWSIRDDWQIDKNWSNTFVYRQNEEKRQHQQQYFAGNLLKNSDTDFKYTFISDQITFHNDRHNLVMGVDYSQGKNQQTTLVNGVGVKREMKNTSFYINEDWTIIPHVTLSGGLRHDRPNEDKYGSKIDSHTTKSYKLAWDVTKKDTVYAGRSEYFILPSMSQKFDATWGNDGLKPAEGRTESVGYNKKFDDNNFFTANYFQTKEECGIGWDGYNRVNTSGVSRGWNAQFSSRLSDKWNFNVGWSHLFEHSDGDDNYTLGYYPRDLATFGVYYNVGKFDAGLDGYWFFRKMDYSGRREFPADNYGIYNLSMNYKPTKNMKLYCKVENIFNKYYAEHTDAGNDLDLRGDGSRKYYAMPGRAFMVGLEFKF